MFVRGASWPHRASLLGLSPSHIIYLGGAFRRLLAQSIHRHCFAAAPSMIPAGNVCRPMAVCIGFPRFVVRIIICSMNWMRNRPLLPEKQHSIDRCVVGKIPCLNFDTCRWRELFVGATCSTFGGTPFHQKSQTFSDLSDPPTQFVPEIL